VSVDVSRFKTTKAGQAAVPVLLYTPTAPAPTVEFDWIASGEHVNAGFVAQEVEQVFPEFVVENMADEGEEERKGLTGGMTGGIVAHLVKAIQEQTDIINDLRARVAQLEGEA